MVWVVLAAAAAGAVGALRAVTAGATEGPLIGLAGPWAFRPGDDPAWAAPEYDHSTWTTLEVPGSWGRQGFDDVREMAWYRLRARLPRRPTAAEPWGVTLGKVDSAYVFYAGGLPLGGVGRLPPAPEPVYDRHRIFTLPADAVAADGTVVLALRVWRAPGKAAGAAGPVEGPFLLGPLRQMIERAAADELADLGLVLVFFLAGVYHLVLRLLRPAAAEYGWFGWLSVAAAGYSFLRTQWKYALADDFLLLKKTEHFLLYLVPVLIVQFLWAFLGRPVPRALRAVQVGLLTVGAAAVAAPGLALALRLLPFVQLTAAGIAVCCVVIVASRLRAGHRDARFVAAGILLIIATLANDALVDRGLVVGPRLAVYGFAVLVMGMSLALAQRFHRVLDDLDALTRELDARVADRTRELERRGEELAEAYRRVEELALSDALTGVLNRRALQERASAILARADRQAEPVALALLDLDHFKAINDRHGHPAGDETLRQVVRRLAGALREYDEIGRWGGEEFLLLLPGLGAAAAAAMTERLRRRVAEEPLVLPGGEVLHVTLSAGVAASGGGEPIGFDELLRRADDALYRAKAAGRNRVEAD